MSYILPMDDFQEALRKAILDGRQQYETQRKLLGLLPAGSPEACGTCGREWPTGEVLCFTCNSYVGPNGIIRRDDLSPETDPEYMPEDDPWGDENAWRDGSIRTGIDRYRRSGP